MTRLLINDTCLVVQPALANKFGLNESIILQQIHYWVTNQAGKNQFNGLTWIYSTYEQWQKQLSIFSDRTIRRAIKSLEKHGVIFSRSQGSYIRVKYYAINYDRLIELGFTLNSSNNTNNASFFGQIDNQTWPIDVAKMASSYKEERLNTKNLKEISLSTVSDNVSIKSESFEKDFDEREMINIWNEVFKEEGRAEIKTNPARKTSLQNIFHDYFESSLDKWRDYCIKITTSKFLMGESKASSFKATLDWSIKPDSIAKILEGEHYGIGDRVKNHKANNLLQPELAPHMLVQNNLWKEILKKFEDRYSIAEVKSWIAKLEFEQVDTYTVRLLAPSRFIMESIDQKYKADLLKYVSELSSYKIRCILLEYGPHSITYRTEEPFNHKETLEIRPSDIMIAEVPDIPTVRVYKEEYNQDCQGVEPFGQQQIGQQADEDTNAISHDGLAKKLVVWQDHFEQNESVNGLEGGFSGRNNTCRAGLTKAGSVDFMFKEEDGRIIKSNLSSHPARVKDNIRHELSMHCEERSSTSEVNFLLEKQKLEQIKTKNAARRLYVEEIENLGQFILDNQSSNQLLNCSM